jgi:hypothetical protein
MNYDELLAEMKKVHDQKGHDYSSGGEFDNFEFASSFAAPFSGVERTFATILGIKFARLRALQGKEAKNESYEDTLKDITIYCSLWWSYKVPSLPKKERATDTYQADIAQGGMDYKGWARPSNAMNQRLSNLTKQDES